MTPYERLERELMLRPRTWLVTGAAGFIGSNLVERLLRLDQRVAGLDNFATGHPRNLEEVRSRVSRRQWQRFRFVKGHVHQLETCRRICRGVDYVLHQAALGSVPRSLEDPLASHESNVTGFVCILRAAQERNVRRVVYASSSSVYGDDPHLPKVEEQRGEPLSPYAVTKCVNELYAAVWYRCYGLESIGLRYFNVFGPRQDPEGAYAAVIPRWIGAMMQGAPVYINGDGKTSRDFCYVDNAVQANLLAATASNPKAVNRVYNVALDERTSLIQLFRLLRRRLIRHYPHLRECQPVYRDFRAGDVRHSLADIALARRYLGYRPTHRIGEGLDAALDWYRQHLA